MKEIITEIYINASPAKVWSVLAASPNWGAWNPFIVRVQGQLKVGGRLVNTMVMKDQAPMTFKPRVLKAEPGVELRWFGRLLFPGLFDGEHYFKLKAKDNGTQLTHGERFSGILAGTLNMDDTKVSFEAFNAGLKFRCENSD